MAHADGARRLRVRANADTPDDSARARRFGAQGIGLCRTEHMFLGDRRELVEHLIVAEDEAAQAGRARRAAAAAAAGLHRDLRGDGRAAGDDPADRPAAARVPPRPHRAVGEGGASPRSAATRTSRERQAAGRRPAAARAEPDARAARASGSASRSPGCSRCRPGRSSRRRPTGIEAGGDPLPEIMIPLVASVRELDAGQAEIIDGRRGGAARAAASSSRSRSAP